MNPIANRLSPGFVAWKKLASVKNLGNSKYTVPRIIYGEAERALIICTGLHLEETSGPLTFLNPKAVRPILNMAVKKDITLIIFPLINNFGLAYSPKDDDKFLRRNVDGVNYNDGWGMKKKAKEVAIVEKDIKEIIRKYKVLVTASLHEDSLSPGKGYLWINGLKDKTKRMEIYNHVKENISTKYLLKMPQKTIMGGKVEEQISIVDSPDEGAYEDWMADVLGIPAILSEAPFGSSLPTRRKFHLEVIKAVVNTLF